MLSLQKPLWIATEALWTLRERTFWLSFRKSALFCGLEMGDVFDIRQYRSKMRQIAVRVSNLNSKTQSKLTSDHQILENSNSDAQVKGSVSSLVSLISNSCNCTKPLQYCPSHSSLFGSVHFDKPPSVTSREAISAYPKNSKLVPRNPRDFSSDYIWQLNSASKSWPSKSNSSQAEQKAFAQFSTNLYLLILPFRQHY